MIWGVSDMARSKGLTWARTADVIHDFVNRFGGDAPRRAIFCTFDFEPQSFEGKILTELSRFGKHFRTLVLVDAGEWRDVLGRESVGPRHGYQVAPVQCRGTGVFHPKLIFLSAGCHHLVGIGSSNLTGGGLGSNLELMYFADDSDVSGRALVAGASHFLEALVGTTAVSVPESAREFITRARLGVVSRDDVVLDSLSITLLSQMAKSCRSAGLRTVKSLAVLSPWHSGTKAQDEGEPKVLNRLRRDLGLQSKTCINLYTEGRARKGPRLPGIRVYVRKRDALPDSTDADEDYDLSTNDPRRTLHAKAYLAQSGRSGVAFVGSANCTMPALAVSASKGGNVEILAATQLGATDVKRLNSDLGDFFCRATGSYSTSPHRRRQAARGQVLSAEFFKSKENWKLTLDVPDVRRKRRILIGGRDGGRFASVVACRGVGIVEGSDALRLLRTAFPESIRDGWQPDVACGVLYERNKGQLVPFSVSLPMIAPTDDGDPSLALEDMLWEELGRIRRPPRTYEDSPQELDSSTEAAPEEADGILDALAETHHQGELDRLAVAVAAWKRVLTKSTLGPQYVRQRVDLLCRQIRVMERIRPHIQREILRYLHSVSVAAKRGTRQ